MSVVLNACNEKGNGRNLAEARLVNVATVAEMLGCSRRHVYRMSDAGRMPGPVKLGQLARWRRAELDEWLAAGCPAMRNFRQGGEGQV